MDGLRDKMKRMERDYAHGSSWYFEQAAILMAEIELDQIESFKLWLAGLRPGMASIMMILDIMEENRIESKGDLSLLSSVLIEEKRETERKLRSQKLGDLGTVMTISYSSAVSSILSSSQVDRVFLLRSSPGMEYRNAYQDYSSFTEVTVIPDSSVSYFMGGTENVLIGFDSALSEGFLINKIGTYPLLLSAANFGKKVIAVGESFKASTAKNSDVKFKKIFVGKKRMNIPIFERVPLKFVRELVTDLGIYEPTERNVAAMYSTFREDVGRKYQKMRGE